MPDDLSPLVRRDHGRRVRNPGEARQEDIEDDVDVEERGDHHDRMGDRPGPASLISIEASDSRVLVTIRKRSQVLDFTGVPPRFRIVTIGTISRHIICSGQLFAQFFRSHPEELPEAQRGQLQAQQAVRRLILSVPGPELV